MKGFYRLAWVTAIIVLVPMFSQGAPAAIKTKTAPPLRTWYSYQSGNWNDPTVWTLDPAVIPLVINPGNEIPATGDQVVITNGRTIIANVSNITVAGALIYGTLDLATFGGHNFTSIGGDGRVKMSGYVSGGNTVDNFPAGDATAFANAITGGTVEFYGAGLRLASPRTFNNVVVNLNTTAAAAIVKADYTINGSLLVSKGTWQIGDATAGTNLSIAVTGNVNVEPTGQITTGNGNSRHQFNFYGDFINNGGSVSFTNLTAANYTADVTTGVVDANFLNDTKDQSVICNGVTKFYRIEIDKGGDDTYKVSLSASATGNFLLYGRANYAALITTGAAPNLSADGQGTVNNNAVGLIFGTLEVGNNILLPALGYSTDSYIIYKGAKLLINGTNAVVTKPLGATTATGAITIYNTIEVVNGKLDATAGTGIELQGSGTLEVGSNGIVNSKQLRAITSATSSGGFIQSGGTVTIDGNTGGTAPDNNYAIFSLTNTANLFRMEAGTLYVRGMQTTSTAGLIFINSDPSSVSVTGGTINAEINTAPAANNYKIASKAPFWNLNLRRTLTTSTRIFTLETITSGTTVIAAQPLTVLGNFAIQSPAALDANGNTVEVQSDFTIENGATYTTDANLTLLSGSANGTLDLGSTTRNFNKLTISKGSATTGVTLANSTNTATLEVNDELRLEQGYLDYDAGTINARRDVYAAGTIGTATSAGKLVMNRNPAGAQTLSSDNALFYNLELNNTSGITLAVGNVRVANTLTLSNGVFNINIFRLTLEGANATISGTGFGTTKMIQTSGEYSDGGVELFYNTTEAFVYPIGTNANGTVRYTPATADVAAAAAAGRFGYIIINPVDDILATTVNSGDALSYYWRVRYRDFTTLPSVAYKFQYAQSDVTTTNQETNYVPGKVLDVSPYTRSADGDNGSVDDNNGTATLTNTIYFNGTSTGTTFPGTRFTLEQANYTAGVPARFTNTTAVRVFYSKTNAGTAQPLWNSAATWTRSDIAGFNAANPHSSTNPSPTGTTAGTSYPGPGDIAIIGWVPYNDPAANTTTAIPGYPHNVRVQDNFQLTCAQIIFNQMKDPSGNPTVRKTVPGTVFIFRPTLTLTSSAALGTIYTVKGEGIIRVRGEDSGNQNMYDPNLSAIDFGEFAAEDSSYFQYENFDDVTISRVPNRLPNLMITSDGFGANDRNVTLAKSITTRGNLEIMGNANLVLSTSTAVSCDINVGGNLLFIRSVQNGTGGAELRFGNTGPSRTVTVNGDLLIGKASQSIDQARLGVLTPNNTGTLVIHNLNLYGNYLQNTTTGDFGLRLGLTTAQAQSNDYIMLNLLGDKNTAFNSVAGSPPQIVRMKVNKGSSIATSVQFNADFDLWGTTNSSPKAIDLVNGLIVLNNSAIGINVTTGGASFTIPGTAGLEVRQGTVNGTGDSGIFLDGLLRVSGGAVNMVGGNNFIEYSSSTKATINITAGTLAVGSQIRRTVSSTDGVLKYIQTGGAVSVGNNAAPATTNRGVFEVVNPQSEFTFTAGSLLVLRGVNSTTVPSILIDPSVYTQYSATALSTSLPTIAIGDVTSASTDLGNIGIKCSIPLPNVTTRRFSNAPVVKLYVFPLTITGKLTIGANTTFNAMGLDLTLQGDFENGGSYVSGGNTTIFSTATNRTLSVTASTTPSFDFYRIEKTQSATLMQGVGAVTVKDQFKVTSGTWATISNSITVLGNVIMEGNMTSTTGSGLIFAGTSTQTLSRINPGGSTLGSVTINNPTKVVVPDGANFNFTINQLLRLQSGVFDIGGNLIILPSAASIVEVNPFSSTNMVRTNASISEGGIRKTFTANYNQNFVFPVGQSEYTPVTFNFGLAGNTTGTTTGSIRVTLSSEVHPSIVEDTETGCQFADRQNALNYYFTIDGQTLTGFKARASLKFPQSALLISNTCGLTKADYIAARILYDNNTTQAINKFSTTEVDENGNLLNFDFGSVTDAGISGDYFAALDAAIPNKVPIYHTRRTGQVTEGSTTGTYDIVTPGGGSPIGAVVIIEPGHTLNFNVDGVTLYKTEIKAGAVLNVSQTDSHRLGIVSGQGTLRITSNTNSAVVPAGFYTDFFGCSGGILEYAGTGSYDVLGGMPNMRNLAFTGSGQRYLANNDIFVCDSMYVNGPEFYNNNGRGITIDNDLAIDAGKFSKGNGTRLLTVHGNLEMRGGEFSNVSIGDRIIDGDVNVRPGCTFYVGAGGTITVGGDINNYLLSTFNGGTGTVMLALEGTETQNLNGTFTGISQLLNVRVNNPEGVNVNGFTDISGQLQLTDGVVTPLALIQLRLLSNASVTPETGRSNSYIGGRLYKTMPAGSSFIFPIGKLGRWRYASLNSVSTGNLDWYAEYHPFNPFQALVTVLPGLSNLTDDPLIKRISISEFWQLSDGELTTVPTTASIGLSWGVESDVSQDLVDQEKLVVVSWLPDLGQRKWSNKGGIFPTAHTQESGYVLSTKTTSFSVKFATLASTDPANPLPVELMNFTGSTINNKNYLSWQTATEVNNDYFEVERSADGATFATLGRVDGGGNLPAGAKYSFIDDSPAVGRNYYRLKQVDFDGTVTYGDKLVILTNDAVLVTEKLDFYIAPNPTSYNDINFLLSHAGSGPVSVKLISMTGLTLSESVIDNTPEDWVRVEAPSSIAQGLYILEIRQGHQKVAKRVLIK